jgi:hypothetical protein
MLRSPAASVRRLACSLRVVAQIMPLCASMPRAPYHFWILLSLGVAHDQQGVAAAGEEGGCGAAADGTATAAHAAVAGR